MLLGLLAIAFGAVTLLQILIWLLFPARWAYHQQAAKNTTPNAVYPSASIVVCARNEAPRLAQNLPLLLNQSYAAPFEVIVVDDASDDHTPAVLEALQAQFPTLRTLRIPTKTHPGKKTALTQGIAATQYPWLVFTDADCQPQSNRWLSLLLLYAQQPGIVLGYAPMTSTNNWLNGWARFETIYTAMQYFSTAYAGWPFMGVGRNMAVHRSLFDAAGGFTQHLHITGGDDDLLVNSIATGQNTRICIAPDAFVYSLPKTNISGWLAQKRRHITAGTGYKTWHNMVLGGVAFTHAVHYGLAAILLIAMPSWYIWICAAVLLRFCVVMPVYARTIRLLHENRLPWWPLYDGVMAIWLGAIAPVFLLLGRKKDW